MTLNFTRHSLDDGGPLNARKLRNPRLQLLPRRIHVPFRSAFAHAQQVTDFLMAEPVDCEEVEHLLGHGR